MWLKAMEQLRGMLVASEAEKETLKAAAVAVRWKFTVRACKLDPLKLTLAVSHFLPTQAEAKCAKLEEQNGKANMRINTLVKNLESGLPGGLNPEFLKK